MEIKWKEITGTLEWRKKKKSSTIKFRYGYRSSRVLGYKVDTRVKPGGTKACKNHICSERNVFTSGILCTEDSRLADQRSRGVQAERKRAWRATPTCFSVVGFAKVVKQRHRVPFMDFCFPADRDRHSLGCSYVLYSGPMKSYGNRVYELRRIKEFDSKRNS